MRRVVERVRGIGPRWVALVLAVAALAASASACAAERPEAGRVVVQDQRGEAAQQGDDEETDGGRGAEPLTLTLSAPEICEAYHPEGGWTHGLEWNEKKQDWEDIEADAWWYWDSVGTMEVEWAASGGDGAYTVTIATETYTGASGTAEVSCAMEHGPILEHPRHGKVHANEDKPLVSSGVKTVTATVTDGTGATAEAAAEVYAQLPIEATDVLSSGQTYTLFGWQVTIPRGTEMMLAYYEESVCQLPASDGDAGADAEYEPCQNHFVLVAETRRYSAYLSLGENTGTETGREIYIRDEDAADAMDLRDRVHRAFDQLAGSLEPSPRQGRN